MKLRREKKLYAIILLKILRCEKKTTAYLEIKKKNQREKTTTALTKLIIFKELVILDIIFV